MQFRPIVAVLIFIGSYLPLSLILLAQNYDYAYSESSLCLQVWRADCVIPFKNPYYSFGIFLTCAVCFLITLLALSAVRPRQEIKITEVKHIPADLMNYTLPYIVSFMSIDYQESSKFLGFIIFLGWMFWISYKSGQIFLNPLLVVMGWRLYDVTYVFGGSSQARHARALYKGHLEPGRFYRQTQVQDVLIVKSDAREEQ